jgi:hypothetical protein
VNGLEQILKNAGRCRALDLLIDRSLGLSGVLYTDAPSTVTYRPGSNSHQRRIKHLQAHSVNSGGLWSLQACQ